MATNLIRDEGKVVKVAVASITSGMPVIKGQITGVALADTDADGNVVIQRRGVFDLAVEAKVAAGNSAVAIGDILYYDAAETIKINKDVTNGVRFGYALEAITSGSNDTIQVLLGT